MNETGSTQLDKLIRELWSSDILAGLYEIGQATNRVTRVDGDVSAPGDILHLPAMPSLTVNNVSSAGAVTRQTVTPTEAQLTVDKVKEVTIDVVDYSARQAGLDILEPFKRDAARALDEQMETDLLALYSDVSTYTDGDSTSNANEDLLTNAVQSLLTAKLGRDLKDPNRCSFVFHTSQWAQLKKQKVFSDASITGEAMGGGLKMGVPSIYGIPTFFSASVASSGSARQNLLFTKDAFALGVQNPIGVTPLAKVQLSEAVVVHCLYGVKTRAEARAALIKTKA